MPFKSKAQIERFKKLVAEGEIKQSIFDKMLKETKDPFNLPERIGTDEEAKPSVDPKRVGGKYK